MKDKIRIWYQKGLWTREMVLCAVKKGILSAEEAEAFL